MHRVLATLHLLSLLLHFCALHHVALADVPSAERDTLVDLYNSTSGSRWLRQYNWLSGDPCTNSWQGVICGSADEHVTSLVLRNNELIGSIPSLSALTALHKLDLASNRLGGSIPDLSSLTALQVLLLDHNSLRGSIPPLSTLDALFQIELQTNSLSGSIPSLSSLTALQYMYLYDNSLSGTIPLDICNIPRFDVFKNLFVCPFPPCCGETNCGICIPPSPPTPPPATALSQIQVTALQALYKSTGGAKWFFNDNWMSASDPCTGQWYGVTCEYGSPQGTNVIQLNLAHNNLMGTLPDPEMGDLVRLHKLYAELNNLNGSLPSSLGKCTALTTVHLNDNDLEGQLPNIWISREIVDVQLARNRLSGTVPQSMASRGPFRVLYLNGNEMSGTVPDALVPTSSGNCFDVRGNDWTCPLPEQCEISGDKCDGPPYPCGGCGTMAPTPTDAPAPTPAASPVNCCVYEQSPVVSSNVCICEITQCAPVAGHSLFLNFTVTDCNLCFSSGICSK